MKPGERTHNMTSSLPNSATAFATRALTSDSLETSHLTARALGASGNLEWMSSTARCAACSLMSATTTCAPSDAKTRADSSPSPLRGGGAGDKWGAGGTRRARGHARACAGDEGDLVLEPEGGGHLYCGAGEEGKGGGAPPGQGHPQPPPLTTLDGQLDRSRLLQELISRTHRTTRLIAAHPATRRPPLVYPGRLGSSTRSGATGALSPF